MTADEYRGAITTLSQAQRMDLCAAISRGVAVGNGVIDVMVEMLQNSPDVERKAVTWLNQHGFQMQTKVTG